MHILIVDDDRDLVISLHSVLKKKYVVDLAFTLEDGEYKATINDYDAIILDYNLPDGIGPSLCRTLRSDNCRTPILMLTGRSEIEDKVLALDNGADDYVLKPFSNRELQARLRALFRRNPPLSHQSTLTYGNISIDLNQGLVLRDNQVVTLRRKEMQILEFLLRNRGQIVRREVLLEHVWQDNREPNTNAIDVHIRQLRKKLKTDLNESSIIKSVYGLGYQIK